jgi:predicted nucleic acid-binding protein
VALVFFDTSALLKLCVHEQGSSLATRLWQRADAVLASRIADVEVRAALAAGERSGIITKAGVHRAKEYWGELWPSLRIVEYSAVVGDLAAHLADTMPLRGGDAIQVASAAQFADAGVVVASWDAGVSGAARAQGLTVVPN